MNDVVKNVLSIVFVSVVLVLILKTPASSTAVINSATSAFAQSVSVLQGNPYSANGLGSLNMPSFPSIGGGI